MVRVFVEISIRLRNCCRVSVCLLAGVLFLTASSETAWAETTTRYGASETHWVDPWQANSQVAPMADPVTRSAAPVLAEDRLLPLTQTIAMYREIAGWGGWERVPAGERLELGVRDPRVATVRKRLVAEGDMAVSGGIPISTINLSTRA